MSLFERINQRTVKVYPNAMDDLPSTELESLTFREVRQAVRSSVRVIADDCAAWCAEDGERWRSTEGHNTFDLMGPLRLPFDSMWFEWIYPESPESDGTQFAAWVTAMEPHEDATVGCIQTLTLVLFMANATTAVYSPVTMFIEVGEHGEALALGNNVDPRSKTSVETRCRLIPALVAIGLMNCRNVEVTESAPPERSRSSKKRRRGAPKKPEPLAHHTITLPGGSRIRSLADAQDAGGGSVPLHVVRGHFKTFTADAPLLGKYVGTYWWAPSVRGSADVGRVETTYQVRPR